MHLLDHNADKILFFKPLNSRMDRRRHSKNGPKDRKQAGIKRNEHNELRSMVILTVDTIQKSDLFPGIE